MPPVSVENRPTNSLAGQGDQPLISIIMPLYNSAHTVGLSIRSVLNQTYQNWELVIVDDGSSDDGVDRVRSFQDERIILLRQENQGASVARNTAVANSKGDYLTFLDADDLWFPEKLATDMRVYKEQSRLHNQPHCMIFSRRFSFNEKYELLTISPDYDDNGFIFDAVLLKDNLISASTCFLTREMYDSVGGFPTFNRYHEDWYFLLLLAKKYPAYPTKERLVLYRQSLTGKARRKFQDYDYAYKASVEGSEPLRQFIDPDEYALFIERQKSSLFCSFMMYNRVDFARRIFPHVDQSLLTPSLKGKLALVGMYTGINVLYLCRLLYQAYTKYALSFWWKKQTGWAFSNAE